MKYKRIHYNFHGISPTFAMDDDCVLFGFTCRRGMWTAYIGLGTPITGGQHENR